MPLNFAKILVTSKTIIQGFKKNPAQTFWIFAGLLLSFFLFFESIHLWQTLQAFHSKSSHLQETFEFLDSRLNLDAIWLCDHQDVERIQDVIKLSEAKSEKVHLTELELNKEIIDTRDSFGVGIVTLITLNICICAYRLLK